MRNFLNILGLALLLCSCGEVKEEIWVNTKDQIKCDITWDMTKEPASGGVSLSSLLSKLGSYMPSSVNTQLMKTAFEQMGIPYKGQTKIDSIVYLSKLSSLQYKNLIKHFQQLDTKTVLTDKEQQQLAKAIVNAIPGSYAQCKIDCASNTYIFKVHTEWIDVEDYNTISNSLYKLDAAYKLDISNAFAKCDNKLLFSVTAKGFKRGACDYAHLIDVNGTGPFASDPKVKYIFGDGKSYDMVSIIHLPKAVSVKSNGKAKLSEDKKTVTLKLSAEDMNAGVTPENDIRY